MQMMIPVKQKETRARPSRVGMKYRRKENRQEKLKRDQENFDKLSNDQLASVELIALVLDRHRATVWAMIKRGDLAAVRIGGSTKIRVGDLRKLIGVA